MKAVILAGGKGTRLRPLTSNIPKPIAQIVNTPMIVHTINLLKKHGFDDIIITIGYLGNQIEDLLRDGKDLGVNITYFKEYFPLGTAGALKFLEEQFNETFLVISSDIITDLNLKEMYEFHKSNESTATIALTTAEIPVAYGIVVTDENLRITKFLEKPGWSQIFSDKINAGIYILEPDVLQFISKGEKFDFSKQLFPKLLEENFPMYGFTMNCYWLDIGENTKYVQANHDVLAKRISLDHLGKEIKESVWIGDETEISPSASLWGPCIIGKNCKIGDNTTIDRLSVIGNNVHIGKNAQIKRSVILNDATIRDDAFIENNVIICPRTEIGEGAKVMAGSVIGEDCHIGEHSVIKHNIKIWPNKEIEPGSFINMNLKHGTYVKKSLFGPYGITGLVNYEFTPEKMTKLGSAIGTYFGAGSKVFIGRDTMLMSRMMKRAVITGLMSTGVEVYNVEALPLPILKYVTILNGGRAGIMLKVPYAEINSINIKIFENDGIELSPKAAKKIEGIFFKENIRRVEPNQIRDIIPFKMAYEQYLEKIMAFINSSIIEKRKPKVVIDCGNGAGSLIAPQIFQKLGCEVISLNTLETPAPLKTFSPYTEALSNLSKTVKVLNADFGFLLNEDAGRVIFVDEKGEILEGDTTVSIFTKIRLQEKGGGKVAVPVHTSNIIEQVADEYNGTVIRTKSGNRPLLVAVQENNTIFGGEETGGFVIPDFQVLRDGILAAAYLTEYLVKKEKVLSELTKAIPPFFMAKEVVPCPITIRGKVMLNLIEEAYYFNFNTLDGIKMFFEDYGWVLIKPSAMDDSFEIYAEGRNKKEATLIARHWIDEINNLIHEIETGM
ncbi:MAG: NTP transferase domain-containing protein [Candidatus Helarchaeota archaeon]|nr:NTP transferase domain-containing protein [Candidatus Helarchaeota archaeon]